MPTTLRKRLRRSSRHRLFLSPNTTSSSPLDPIDLEANSATSDATCYFQSSSFEAARGMFRRHSATTPELQPGRRPQPATPSATVPVLVLSVCLVIMFLSNPQGMLRAVLASLLFAPYPPHISRWMILVPLLVPMSIKVRFEVILFLGLNIWLHVGYRVDWWFVIQRLQEAWQSWMTVEEANEKV